jgi:hypothetical protein
LLSEYETIPCSFANAQEHLAVAVSINNISVSIVYFLKIVGKIKKNFNDYST